MLEKLIIRNFQCHRYLAIGFNPQITVLTGESDAGKSAVLRALWWLCSNSPSGTSLIRHGANKPAVVRLQVDGRAVKRLRGLKRGNLFVLDGRPFHAFGKSGMPEGIAFLLNVSEVNYQSQLSPHFWFSLTPGQVARELNGIVNLEVIDRTLANAASGLRKAKATVEVSEGRLKQARVKRDELKWIKDCDKDWRRVETVEEKLIQQRAKIVGSESVLREWVRLRSALSVASQAKVDALALLQKADKTRELHATVVELENLLAEHEQKEGELCRLRKQLSSVSEKLAKVRQCPLCQSPLK